MILFPVWKQNHWILTIMTHSSIEIYDPLHNTHLDIEDKFRKFQQHIQPTFTCEVVYTHGPEQHDSHNCGLYVLLAMKTFVQGKQLVRNSFSESDVYKERYSLLQNIQDKFLDNTPPSASPLGEWVLNVRRPQTNTNQKTRTTSVKVNKQNSNTSILCNNKFSPLVCRETPSEESFKENIPKKSSVPILVVKGLKMSYESPTNSEAKQVIVTKAKLISNSKKKNDVPKQHTSSNRNFDLDKNIGCGKTHNIPCKQKTYKSSARKLDFGMPVKEKFIQINNKAQESKRCETDSYIENLKILNLNRFEISKTGEKVRNLHLQKNQLTNKLISELIEFANENKNITIKDIVVLICKTIGIHETWISNAFVGKMLHTNYNKLLVKKVRCKNIDSSAINQKVLDFSEGKDFDEKLFFPKPNFKNLNYSIDQERSVADKTRNLIECKNGEISALKAEVKKITNLNALNSKKKIIIQTFEMESYSGSSDFFAGNAVINETIVATDCYSKVHSLGKRRKKNTEIENKYLKKRALQLLDYIVLISASDHENEEEVLDNSANLIIALFKVKPVLVNKILSDMKTKPQILKSITSLSPLQSSLVSQYSIGTWYKRRKFVTMFMKCINRNPLGKWLSTCYFYQLWLFKYIFKS